MTLWSDDVKRHVKTYSALGIVFAFGIAAGGWMTAPQTLEQHEIRITVNERTIAQHIQAEEVQRDRLIRRIDRLTCVVEQASRAVPDYQSCSLGGGDR